MGVYISLGCLLLACLGGSAQSTTCTQSDYETALSVDPPDVIPLVTKELVFTCTVVNTSSCFWDEIYSIAFVAVERRPKGVIKEIELAKVSALEKEHNSITGTWIMPGGVFATEQITGHISTHRINGTRNSQTGYIQLSISYPTLQQTQSYGLHSSTMCRVRGSNNYGHVDQNDQPAHVHIKNPTFQSLGGDFEVNPADIKPLLTDTLTVKCNVNGIEAVKRVNEISVVKDGVIVARMALGHIQPTNTSNFPNATIKGKFIGSNGHLIVTVNYPMKVHSGSFECMIKVVNQEDMELEETSDADEVYAKRPDLNDVVERVHDLIVENKGLTKETHIQASQIAALNTTNINQQTRIGALDTITTNLQEELTEVQNTQSGTEECGDSNGWQVFGNQRVKTINVKFPTSYSRVPTVHHATVGFDDDNDYNSRFVISGPFSVTKHGFVMKCLTWHDSRNYVLTASWISVASN